MISPTPSIRIIGADPDSVPECMMGNVTLAVAFEDGWRTASEGLARDLNPHPALSEKAAEWNGGWFGFHREHEPTPVPRVIPLAELCPHQGARAELMDREITTFLNFLAVETDRPGYRDADGQVAR